MKNIKYSLDDYCIVPAQVTDIEHRSECNPYNADNMLPLFTAPMSSVINDKNYQIFLDNKVNTIIPRNIDINIRKELMINTFVAMGLGEFEHFVQNTNDLQTIVYICVDIANGHMRKLLDVCRLAKQKFGGFLVLMAGNIANPATYRDYAEAGIDFVRVGIGSGSACITAANSSCFYPMKSLLDEIQMVKRWIEKDNKLYSDRSLPIPYPTVPFIIADGGFSNFDQIIKALASGADYVMCGKLFAQTEEACGVTLNGKRDYYGMSTKRAQREFGQEGNKTSEGIEFQVNVLYTLSGWCDNFTSYLRTAMSYTNSLTLEDLKQATLDLITPAAQKNFYK